LSPPSVKSYEYSKGVVFHFAYNVILPVIGVLKLNSEPSNSHPPKYSPGFVGAAGSIAVLP